jgi:hypothetical protein
MTMIEDTSTPIYDALKDEWPQLWAKHEVDAFLAIEEARRETEQEGNTDESSDAGES